MEDSRGPCSGREPLWRYLESFVLGVPIASRFCQIGAGICLWLCQRLFGVGRLLHTTSDPRRVDQPEYLEPSDSSIGIDVLPTKWKKTAQVEILSVTSGSWLPELEKAIGREIRRVDKWMLAGDVRRDESLDESLVSCFSNLAPTFPIPSCSLPTLHLIIHTSSCHSQQTLQRSAAFFLRCTEQL